MELLDEDVTLSRSFSQALTTPVQDEGKQILAEILEAGLDTVIEDDFLCNIPFLSIAISLVKMHSNLERWFMLKKLANFIDQINDDISEDERTEYIEKFNQQSRKDRDRELEHLLIIINRYITEEQPRYLAKVYLSFLQGDISFSDLVLFSKMIDVLLPNDIFVLIYDALPRNHGNLMNYSDYIGRLRIHGLIEANSTDLSSLGQALKTILQGSG